MDFQRSKIKNGTQVNRRQSQNDSMLSKRRQEGIFEEIPLHWEEPESHCDPPYEEEFYIDPPHE